jgi:Protein of unknown function (DUF2637)
MHTSARHGEADVDGAARFFWVWLVTASSMSVAGNVTHAIMNAPRATVALAAAAAVVPPAVLLGSTHSVALLVKTRRAGASYWCALMMTIGLAGCAFVLSFDALRDLAVTLGFHPDRAWLWPVAIDVSIAQSTLALLTLAPHDRDSKAHDGGARGSAVPQSVDSLSADRARARPAPQRRSPAAGVPATPASVSVPTGRHAAHWKTAADRLVRDGVTSKDPELVAAILADHAAGTAPSAIGRRQNVHHSTVNRILSAAQTVTI